MGGDDTDRTLRRRDIGPHGTARLPLGKRDVMHLAVRDGPAADQHLPVIAVAGGDGFGAHAVLAQGVLQHREGIVADPLAPRVLAARVHLLQRNDVGVPALDQLQHAGEIKPRIAAGRAVNVPGHHAHGRRTLVPHGRSTLAASPLRLDTRTCRPTDMPIHAATAATSSAISPAVGLAKMRMTWCPSSDSAIRPGAMPSIVPAMKSNGRMALAPATRFTTVNGASGTSRMVATATTPWRAILRRTRLSRGPSTLRKACLPSLAPTA